MIGFSEDRPLWRVLSRVAQGRNTEDNRTSTLLVVHENDGSWTFHGLGVPGVKISESDAVDLAQGILTVAQ